MNRVFRAVITWLIVAVIAFFGIRFLIPLFQPEEEETDIQTTVVSKGDLRKVVPADGKVVPAVLVEVKSKASGVVESVSVEPGDVVNAGDVLVELDKEEILAQLRQAQADVTAAKAQLELTKRNFSPQQKSSRESAIRQATISRDDAKIAFDRIAELYEKEYATKKELDDARRALDSAEESLAQAREQMELDKQGAEPEEIEIAQATLLRRQATLDNTNEELANTTIRAPIDGTVLTRPVEVGTAVASGTSGNTGGTVVATVGDLSTMYVEARIEETDLGKVDLDIACRVTFDAYTGWLWTGKVSKIYPEGESSQGGTQFQVDIEIDLESAKQDGSGGGGKGGPGSSGKGHSGGGAKPPAGAAQKPDAKDEITAAAALPTLRKEMTANVEIVLSDHPDVLILPAQYVKFDENRTPVCEVLPDPENQDEREKRELVVGFTDGLRYEVISGLEEGETVILERPIRQDRRF